MKKRKSGFTLVELLVVISIIAVLLTVLLPVLSRSRQIAYRIACLNNLKQLAVATETYTQSYKYYPVSVSEVNETWDAFLADTDIAKDKMLGVPVSLWPFYKDAKIYDCPVLSKMHCDISYCYNWLAGRQFTASDPTFADAGTSDIRPTPSPNGEEYSYHLLSPEKVKSPGIFALLYDQPFKPAPLDADTTGYDSYKDIDPDDFPEREEDLKVEKDNPGNLWHYRRIFKAAGPHSKGQNILFGDSHAKWYPEPSDADKEQLSSSIGITRNPD